MSRRHIIWSLLALLLLLAGGALWNRYRAFRPSSRPLPIGEQIAKVASHTHSESPRRPSELAANLPTSSSPQSNILSGASVAPPQNAEPEDLYRELLQSDDALQKRKLRKTFAALKPAEIPFRFALAKYESANSDEEKLHLQSILSQIDVSNIASEVASVASQTLDESLFVSLVYSLRRSTNVEAKKELLNLAANNRLPAVRPDSLMSNQGLVALHRCLLDSLQPSDLVWVHEYLQKGKATAVQERILTDFLAKTESRAQPPQQ